MRRIILLKLCVNIPFPYSLLYSYFIHITCVLHCSHISCSSYSFNFITSLTWACWLSPLVYFHKKVSQLYQSFHIVSLLYLLHSPKINNKVQGWMISKEMHNMGNPLSASLHLDDGTHLKQFICISRTWRWWGHWVRFTYS